MPVLPSIAPERPRRPASNTAPRRHGWLLSLVVAIIVVSLPPGHASATQVPAGAPSSSTESPPPGAPFADLPGWKLAFSDEFSTAIPRGSFEAESAGRYYLSKGWRDTSGNGLYDPRIIAVQNGMLDIAMGTYDGTIKVASFSPLPNGSLGKRGDLLGMRVEFRLRADRMVGYKGVPLLWPLSGKWPYDGEIDWPESEFDEVPRAYMHRQGATSGSDQDYYFAPEGTRWQDWHDYALEWVPGTSVEFFLDGVSIGRSRSRVPVSAMHLSMQFETQLSGGAPSSAVSGHVQVDRLAVWALDPQVDSEPVQVSPPRAGYAAGGTIEGGRYPVRLSWNPLGGGAASRYDVQRSVDGGTYATVATVTGTALTSTVAPRSTYRFRVRGYDAGSTAGPWAYGPPIAVRGYGEGDGRFEYSGRWRRSSHDEHWGNATRYSGVSGRRTAFRFTGSAAALVAPRGPGNGAVRVYVDGSYTRTIDLHARRRSYRRVVPLYRSDAPASHTVELVVVGTADHARVDVDGILTFE